MRGLGSVDFKRMFRALKLTELPRSGVVRIPWSLAVRMVGGASQGDHCSKSYAQKSLRKSSLKTRNAKIVPNSTMSHVWLSFAPPEFFQGFISSGSSIGTLRVPLASKSEFPKKKLVGRFSILPDKVSQVESSCFCHLSTLKQNLSMCANDLGKVERQFSLPQCLVYAHIGFWW